MKPIWALGLAGILLFLGTSCKEVQRRPSTEGMHLVVHDMPCGEVKNNLLGQLAKKEIPCVLERQEPETYRVGPVQSLPLPEDPFRKVEEKGRLEIRCLDPLSTRISIQWQVRGMTADERWLEIKDPEKINRYGARFLDPFMPKP